MGRALTGLAPLALSLAIAGCGSASPPHRPAGATLFTEDCSLCHSLSGVQSPRRQGGDLLHAHFSRSVMLQFVREMPVRHRLTPAELSAVSDYVVAVQDRGR